MTDLPKSVGTIGAGNMAEAVLRGLVRRGVAADALIASDPDVDRRNYLAKALGVRTTEHNPEVVRSSDVVVIAVKPAQLEVALRDLPAERSPLYVSVVAGRTLADLRTLLSTGARVIRTMPNTPALIGAGITALAVDPQTGDSDLDQAEAVLRAVGRVVRVPEAQLDAVTGVSGSGPAYVYTFVEALTDAAVREGLPLDIARSLVVETVLVETVLGSASLLRETGEHPAVLRDRVTSPGGTTSAGLAALEAGGFRTAVLGAVRSATARSRELGRKR
jgi:pyrroline-5-carboxylate reductase